MGGRKLTMAISTALTGIFLFLFTTSTTDAAVFGFSRASGLTQWVFFLPTCTYEISINALRC